MKDVHAILRDKEQDLQRIRREVQALLLVIPLLAEEQSLSENALMNALTVVPVSEFMEPASEFMEPAPAFIDSPRKPQEREPFSQLLTSWLSGKKI
jgi:hypothetical protein